MRSWREAMTSSHEASSLLRFVSLSATDFRNLAPFDFAPGACLNVISGDNAEGKSNLLELIDYVSTLGSFRGARTQELVCQGRPGAEVAAGVSSAFGCRRHRIRLWRKGRREVTLDGKRPRSKMAYQQTITTVAFHPGSILLVAGPAEHRRAFMDRMLEQFDPTYGATLVAYQRAVRSRNRLLKEGLTDIHAIGAYDELLASAGAVLGQARGALIRDLAPSVEEAFGLITDDKSPLRVSYLPKVEPDVASIRSALERSFRKDMALRYTTQGPHADDLSLELANIPARHYASQGQHRAMVLALKVGELRELERRKGWPPILLLDDVSSELDRSCNRRLFDVLTQLGGQVFLTTTHPELILGGGMNRRDFRIRAGVISEVTP